MVSAGLLIAGLGSAMMLTLKTLPTDATAGAENNRASRVLSQLADDLQHATNFTEQTASAVTFTVPDRDGDGKVETLRYSWNGTAGQSLKYQYNTNTAVDIATNVQAFNLAKLNRTIAAAYAGPPTNYSVLYEAYSETKVGADNTQITIPVPGGTLDDRLLIAAIVTDGAVATSIVAPADWNSLGSVVSGSAVGLSLFWKFTSAESGNYTFTWTGAETAYGCVMRFNQVNPVAPFNASATSTQGQSLLSLALPTPAVTTTQDNCMILRLIGVNGKRHRHRSVATNPHQNQLQRRHHRPRQRRLRLRLSNHRRQRRRCQLHLGQPPLPRIRQLDHRHRPRPTRLTNWFHFPDRATHSYLHHCIKA